jgi:uncharacterized protein
MPDQTTPEDHLNDRPVDAAQDSPWIEGAREADGEDGLNAADGAEVAAFRENLETAGARSAEPGSDDLAKLAGQLQAHRSQLPTRPPGPGIPEAAGWMVGVIVVHLIGMIIALVAVMTLQVVEMSSGGVPPSRGELQAVIMALPETFALELMTIEMLVFLVSAVVATRLRLGPRTARLMGFRSLETKHILLIAAVSIPNSLMCGGFHQITLGVWNEFFAHLPGMSFFEHLNVNESIKPLGESAPIGLLFLVVAVAPAIGEEVIFRGIIGRGLVARHGILAGVIMTSVLFAAVHIHPAHVVALLPLAFFIHLSYLVTRSILAPMLLHLLNNSLAVVLLKASATMPALAGASEPAMPAYVLLISAGIVGLVGWTLWKSRVEYRTDDGEIWSPGYPSVEMPPESVGATPTMTPCPQGLHRGAVGLAGTYSLVFVVSLVLMLTGHISA